MIVALCQQQRGKTKKKHGWQKIPLRRGWGVPSRQPPPKIKTNMFTVSSYGEAHIKKNPNNIPVFTTNNESFWIISRESRLEAGDLFCGPAGLTVDK